MKRFSLFLLAILAFGQMAWAQDQVSVSYVDENGTTQTHNAYKLDEFVSVSPSGVNIGNTGFTNWYFVEGNNVVLYGQLGYNGGINLILCDGAKLTVNNTGGNAIQSLDNTDTKYTLTIYVQTQGTGQLVAIASGNKAIQTENLTIHGGVINATGGANGIYAPNSNIIINGGTVTAEAGGNAIEGFNVTINGGVVSATGNGGIKNGLGGGRTTLGYTNSSDDQITATSYLLGNDASSVYIKDGQYMITDNGVIVYGWLNEDKRNAIAGRILSPYIPTEWTGHGTLSEPYIIDSEDDLILLSLRTNGGSHHYRDTCFKLGANITYTPSTTWNDATSTEHNFTAISGFEGHFNGDGYTISGLRIFANDNYHDQNGLFTNLGSNAYIENLTISNARIAGQTQVGAIAGYVNSGATVTNCHVTGTVTVHAYGHTLENHGGIVGANYGTVSNCVSEATITRSCIANDNGKTGGIVGTNHGTLSGNKVFNANLTVAENYGAIAGLNDGGTLTNNYYRACTVNGTANAVNIGVNGADITTSDGAMSIHTITKPNDVTITTEPTLVYGGTNFWKYGTTITLSGGLDDTPTEGWQKAYFVNGTANTSDPFTPSNTFTITPARDIEITIGQIHGDWANEYNNPSAGSSSDNPYKIYFTDQLDLLATRVNNGTSTYSGNYFKLMDDLTYSYNGLGSNESNYTPIGFGYGYGETHYFMGNFDGNNKIVSGIRIRKTGTGNDACFLGLFGSTDRAEVKDVIIKDSEIIGHQYLGGVVGYSWSSTVSGCHVWNDVSIVLTNDDSNTVGGIVGNNNLYYSATVTNCISEVQIQTNTNSHCYNIGGIVGLNDDVVSNCFVLSAHIGSGSHLGAIVGAGRYQHALSNNYYRNCVVNNASTNVGCDGADVTTNDGAIPVFTVSVPNGVTASATATVTHNTVNYYKESVAITLSGGLTGETNPGCQKAYFINGQALTESTLVVTNTFDMPLHDVTVTVSEIHADWETAGNAGTENDPYEIYFTDQLDLLATRVNDGTAYHAYADKYFKLMNDLTYSYEGLGATESNFTAIGGYNNHFSGHFNGNNKTISGIRIYKGGTAQAVDDYQGLFGYIDSWYPHGPGDVKNLTLNDAVITGRDCVGGIVGRLNAGTVDSCHVTSSVFIHSVASDDIYCHGGIVGQLINTPSVVSHCTSSATLTANQNATYIRYFGGIVGSCNNSTLTDNFAIGAIIPGATESYHNGAIAGSVSYSTVERNYYQGCKVESTNVTPSSVGCGGYNVDPYDITEEDGAVPVFTISVANGISFTATPTFTYDEINYYKEGVPVTLSGGMDVTVPVGYQRRYYLNEVPFNGNTFNMPAANANITVATELIDWEVEYAGSEENPYLIYNEEQWDLLAERVNSGHSTYQDKFFKLMADFINHVDYSQVETMVGNSTEHTFNGTFDGNGHELFCIIDNVKKENGLGNYTAPFRYVNGATFKHMYLSGHVTSSYKYNGGIVAHSQGTVNIIDCRVHSSVRNDMDFPWNADGTDSFHGGFVAHISSGSVSFEGCVFDGWFLSGCDIRNGGFVGQTDSGVSVSLRNCIFAPNAVDGHDAHTGNTTFVRLSSGVTSSMTNCYYNNVAAGTCPTKQGLQARSINGGEDVVVTYTGTPIEYSRANVTGYANGNADLIGLKWNDVLYAGKNETMAINLQFTGELPEHNVPVYTVSNATLNGTESPFTLNMGSSTDAAVVISCNNAVLAWEGHGTEDDPYLIHTNEQWDLLAEKVNTDNKTYSGIYFKLMADITISYTIDDNYPNYLPKLVGYDENHSFQGTFDGNNHKITLDYYDQTYVDVCAPFRFVKNATIKRLLVDGEIQKEYKKNVASIVGDSYGTTNLISCYSEAGVYNHKGNHTNYPDERDGTSGGLVGRVSGGTINLTNCSYNGKFAGTSGTLPGGCTTYTTKWGGLVAYVAENCTANLINCFCEIRVELWITDGSEYFARKHSDATVNLINCYRSDKLEYPNPGDTNKVFPNSDQGIDATNMTDEELHNALGYAWMTYASTYHDHHVLPITAPQTFTGSGTQGEPYQIATAEDWDKFAIYVAHKDSRSSDYFQMTDDISTTNMIGLLNNLSFQGTFDGAGNTLNLDYNVTYMPDNKAFSTAAPFAYISNAAIKNLHITGSIATVGMRPASVAGFVVENSSITNCKSEVAISSSYNNDIDAGGFVARVNEEKPVTLTGCLFTGSITYSNTAGYEGGGMVGWTQDNATATLTDCVFAPSAIHITKFVTNNDDKKHRMFVGGKRDYVNLTSCYYNDVAAASGMVAEGERVYSIIPAEPVTMSLLGVAQVHDVSGITVYDNGSHGLKFDDVFYAVSGSSLSLELGVEPGYSASAYYANGTELTESGWFGNSYGLMMPAQNVIITAPASTLQYVYREIKGYGESTESDHWAFIASPIAGSIAPTNVTNLIGNAIPNTDPVVYDFDLYRFNPNTDLEWENYHAHTSDFNIVNGTGYLYATKEDKTLAFSGTFNTGTSMDVTGLPQGFNLVGNPFTVDAYVNKPYYTLNSNGSAIVAKDSNEDQKIPPCYGVIVEVNENETVTFNKTGQFSAGPNNGGLNVALTQANTRGASTGSATLLDNAIVSFNEGSQLGKFYFGNQNANIYLPQNGKDYAIAFSDKQGEVPVNFKANENGTYTLSVNPEGVEMGYLHLIDNMTGADVDLLTAGPSTGSGTSYTFTAKTTDYESRFKLVFGVSTPSTGSGTSATFAFVDANGNIVITDGPSTGSGTYTLQIVDVMGRVIVSRDAARNISTSGIPAGVYVLRLIDGNDVKTQRIIIQ